MAEPRVAAIVAELAAVTEVTDDVVVATVAAVVTTVAALAERSPTRLRLAMFLNHRDPLLIHRHSSRNVVDTMCPRITTTTIRDSSMPRDFGSLVVR